MTAADASDDVKTVDVGTGRQGLGRPARRRVFGIEPNVAVMHQVVTAQLAAARAGTHSTKTRAEVAGGGAKPWRQKGTGRARQGSIRAPHWRGGGVAHGPKPRNYTQQTPKKMVRLALRSAPVGPGRRSKRRSSSTTGARRRPKTKDALAALDGPRLRTDGPARAAGAAGARPHRRDRVEVVPQPRRPGADHPPRGAQHLRRARERLARLHQGDARHDGRPARAAPKATATPHRRDPSAATGDARRPSDARTTRMTSDEPPRHHHPAGRVGEVVRALRRERLHVRGRRRRQQDPDQAGRSRRSSA